MKNSAIGSRGRMSEQNFTKEELWWYASGYYEWVDWGRHEQGIIQKKLEELSGVSQPVILGWRQKDQSSVGYGLKVFSQFRKDTSSRSTWSGKRLIEKSLVGTKSSTEQFYLRPALSGNIRITKKTNL